MGVLFAWSFRGAWRHMPGHSQMHEQGYRVRALAPGHTVASRIRGEPQQHEFSIALDGLNPAARQMLLERHGIVDEIRFPKRNREDAPSEDCLPQSARYRFDFGKFRH